MNKGLFGFFIGANVTVDVQEFDSIGIWNKPENAQLCFIEGTGGGQAGGGDGTNALGPGGCAGCAYQITVVASRLRDAETVTIGDGGLGGSVAGGAIGADTLFSGFTWAGGLGSDGSSSRRQVFFGAGSGGGWGRGGGTVASAGCHGGFGAGGGGRGAAGGKARSFEFRASDEGPAHGGGAAANTSASVLNDVDGFGAGGGGGTGASNGGNGRRGSGGGGSGNLGTFGGSGGSGFLRVVTYCW